MYILVVEDERRLAQIVRRVPEEEGHTVDLAHDGKEGLAMASDGSHDVILLDILLPEIDGIEVCRTLRRNRVDTPVLLLTALGDVDDRVRGLDAGADDYLAKPFAFQELLARIRALGRRKVQAREPTQLEVDGLMLDLRRRLFDQVNSDLVARAERESQPVAQRLLQRIREGGQLTGIKIGPDFTAGGYFYAVAAQGGTIIGSTPNADPAGLANPKAIDDALAGNEAFIDTTSSEGEQLRVHLVPLGRGQDRRFVLEVGRSTEPERKALRGLLLILAIGGGAGILLAVGAGFWLAGRALRPIQNAMDRQRGFVADASHELRTPLSLIRANAEILERHREQPVSANIGSVGDIIGETDRLSALVGQMLTLAQADSDTAAFSMATVDFSAIAQDAARQMRLLAEPKGISLDLDADGPLTVSGDATRLRELVTILDRK